jgi:hypothetical protein
MSPRVDDNGLDMEHFEALRNKIAARLRQIGTRHAQRQIQEYPWLYGALGEVPSDVMFICENPSLGGVEKAHERTITGGAPCIEDQWCGGAASNCIKRFRPALYELGLKTTQPLQTGGWRCYITNVIKEADIVRDFGGRDKAPLAVEWADVIAWELEQVRPRVLFTVGTNATELVKLLQQRNLIPSSPQPIKLMHYSNRGRGVTDELVRTTMTSQIKSGLTVGGVKPPTQPAPRLIRGT